MIRSISKEVAMAALGPEPDPLKVLTIAADKIKLMPFSFLDTLADLACQTSPMKVKSGRGHLDDIATLGKSPSSNKRPRAYSESWLGQNGTGPWPTKTELTDMKKDALEGAGLLPQMLDHYAEIYNKNGRIGIYTRQERDDIIDRFRAKKRRRVWKKKIRYHCRKNLADRRVRVKGRFVRRGSSQKAEEDGDGVPSPSGDGSMEGDEEEILEEDESEGEEGIGRDADVDAAPNSSADAALEAGSKRSRAKDETAANKQKKPRRVLFDESAVDSTTLEGNLPAQVRPSSSPESNTNNGHTNPDEGDSSEEDYSRMRRHSIAY